MKIYKIIILVFSLCYLNAEDWKLISSNQLHFDKFNIKDINYDGVNLTVSFIRQPSKILINDRDVQLNESIIYNIRDGEMLKIPDRHGLFEIGYSHIITENPGYKYFKIKSYFNANSFNGPETTIIWTFAFQLKSAQQGDAPEPATIADPASPSSSSPAR